MEVQQSQQRPHKTLPLNIIQELLAMLSVTFVLHRHFGCFAVLQNSHRQQQWHIIYILCCNIKLVFVCYSVVKCNNMKSCMPLYSNNSLLIHNTTSLLQLLASLFVAAQCRSFNQANYKFLFRVWEHKTLIFSFFLYKRFEFTNGVLRYISQTETKSNSNLSSTSAI